MARQFLFLLRYDFNPVAVRVGDEINAHGGVFKLDAAHLLVLFVRGSHIRRRHGEVIFELAEIIGLGAVAQPGELQLEIGLAVAEVDELERPVGREFLPHRLQTERLLVKCKAFFQIEDVEIEVIEGKHGTDLPVSF